MVSLLQAIWLYIVHAAVSLRGNRVTLYHHCCISQPISLVKAAKRCLQIEAMKSCTLVARSHVPAGSWLIAAIPWILSEAKFLTLTAQLQHQLQIMHEGNRLRENWNWKKKITAAHTVVRIWVCSDVTKVLTLLTSLSRPLATCHWPDYISIHFASVRFSEWTLTLVLLHTGSVNCSTNTVSFRKFLLVAVKELPLVF